MTNDTTDSDRAASTSLAVGAGLLLFGNVLHPVDADPTPLSRLEHAAGLGWVLLHVAIALGVLAVTAGLVLFARSRGGPAATVLSVAAIVGGGTMAVVFAGLDGYGMRALAGPWASASGSERDVIEGAATALDAIDTGLAGFGTLALMGIAMIAVAIVARTATDRAWIAVLAGVVGVLGTAAGTGMLVQGATGATINLLLRPTAVGVTATVISLAVTLRRGSWDGEVAPRVMVGAPAA